MKIRNGNYDEAMKMLRYVYIGLAMLKKKNYVNILAYHFLITKYHEGNIQFSYFYFVEIKHPAIAMQRLNFTSFVAEDIELANRSLKQSSEGFSGQSEVNF